MSRLDPYEVIREEVAAWEKDGLDVVAVTSRFDGGVIFADGQYLSLVDSDGDVVMVTFRPGELVGLAKEILRREWQ